MKKVFYIVFLIVLFIPLLGQLINWPVIIKLHGYTGKEEKAPILGIESILNREWQDSIEDYINSSTRVRPSFVRFKNFFDYELFDLLHVKSVFRGKDNYLFYGTKWYLEGGDNVGIEKINENVARLKDVQENLMKEGKELLFVIAPEKIFVYSEFLPNHMTLKKGGRFMYNNYKILFKENNINHIDFNDWFLQQKGINKYEMFARGGKHWTHYYAIQALDSIGDKLRKNGLSIPDFISLEPKQLEYPRAEDIDTWEAANLPFLLEKGKFAKPVYELSNEEKPKIIFCSDSYINTLAWSSILREIYNNKSQYWYYNKEMYDFNLNMKGAPSQDEFNKIEKDIEVYVIITSVGNIAMFDYGFLNYFE